MPQKTSPAGLVQPGNIDLYKRPHVRNADGSISTVRSLGVNIDGREVLIPTVVGDRVVSDDEAIEHYRKTGEHLGMFDTPEHSTAYASQLHNDYAAGKYDMPQKTYRVTLSDGRKFKVKTDGGPPSEADVLGSLNPPAADETPQVEAAPAPKQGSGMEAVARKVAQYVPVNTPLVGLPIHALADVENLPTMGGAIGGLAGGVLGGGVGAVPGAAAGGAAGEGLRRVVRGEPLDEVTGYGKAAAIEAANEAGGRIAPAVVREVGTGIYNLGLSPAKALSQGFGGARKIAQTAMDAGAWLPGSKRFGVAPVNAARAASSQEATRALAGTLPPGARIRTDVPLKELGELRRNVRSPEKVVDLAAIDAFEKNVRAGHPQGFTAEELEAFKQGAQTKASTHYRVVEKGGDPTGQITADANAAVGKGAREFLEKLSPAVKPINQRTTALIGAQRAMEDVVGRSNLARTMAVAGTAAYNPKAAAVAALMLPQVGGPAGFGTYHAGKALGRARLPDVARVIEMLQRQETLDQLGSER